MRILETEPILTEPLLDPAGEWEPGDAIQIIADDIALEALSEAFEALTTDFRLSMPYVARVIRIMERRGQSRRRGDRRAGERPDGERLVTVVAGTDIPVHAMHRLVLGVRPFDAATVCRWRDQCASRKSFSSRNSGRGSAPPQSDLAAAQSSSVRVQRNGTIQVASGSASSAHVLDPCLRPRPPHRAAALRGGGLGRGGPREPSATRRRLGGGRPRSADGAIHPRRKPGVAGLDVSGIGTHARRCDRNCGRVENAAGPVRWPRVVAVRRGTNQIVGRAHGDERGEFVLAVRRLGLVWPPARSTFDVELIFYASPALLNAPTDAEIEARRRDQLVDLAAEVVPRTSMNHAPNELDNPQLRGDAVPPTYVQSPNRPVEQLQVGQLTTVSAPYIFP